MDIFSGSISLEVNFPHDESMAVNFPNGELMAVNITVFLKKLHYYLPFKNHFAQRIVSYLSMHQLNYYRLIQMLLKKMNEFI